MNLSTARRLLQKHLTDSCRISREVRGYHDDVLDIATGALVPTISQEEVYAGPCLVRPAGIGQTVEGARVMERRGYVVRLPWDAGPFRKGDLVTVTAADPDLDGRRLRLTQGSEGATMDHGTILQAEDVEAVEPD